MKKPVEVETHEEDEVEVAPSCPRCKTNAHVGEHEIIVHLDIHLVWQCNECNKIIERID